MKLTAAVLAAGGAISLTTAVVGAARLRQSARHQAERNEATVARNQLDWLTHMSTNPDLAKLWAPEDMDVEEYMQLLKANQPICTHSLRHRLGFVRDERLPFFASVVMNSDVCRRYWVRFGDLRAQEADANEHAERFTDALNRATHAHSHERPIDTWRSGCLVLPEADSPSTCEGI